MIRLAVAAIVIVVMGIAVLGIRMGDAPADEQAAPNAAQVQAAKARIAAAGAAGRRIFEDEGCNRCHSLAAVGADGKLGPRLDTLDDDAEDISESITDPRDEIEDGFSSELMPTDYGERLTDSEIAALAALISAASGSEAGREEDRGRGRGRGRGGRGRGGEGD